jgi:light-regulated signal transduction histidine kinase (bacteriophytochrome)
VLQTVLETMESRIREENAEIVRGDLPSIRMPAVRLQQVFQNLISNAIKYRSEAPARIAISASSQNGSWLFSVSDNGIGIDARYHERIFGIFKRLHTKAQYPGTGIGLAICKRIIENYGGRIWVESEPGRGSTFRFTVPAAPRRASQSNEFNDRAARTL